MNPKLRNILFGKRITLVNILVNSNFGNGTTGWTNSGLATFSADSNELTCLADTIDDYFYQTLTCVVGHVYYWGACVKTDSSVVRVYMSSAYAQTTGSGNYDCLSVTKTATTVGHTVGIRDHNASGWSNFYARFAMCIDLTASFGEGNEPTAAYIDSVLYKAGWFEGSKTITP